MQAETFRKIQPVEFYRKFLANDIRPDGRSVDQTRSTAMDLGSISKTWGSALVRQGNTTVVCGITAEYSEAQDALPNKGFIGRRGPAGERAQQLTVFLDNMVQRTNPIDLSTLCVVAGKVVWTLYCDITVMVADGALEDVCLLALCNALINLRLPEPIIDEDDDEAVPVPSAHRTISLDVQMPTSLSFAVFDGKYILVDPTNEEELLSSAMVTVVVTASNQLAMVNKSGSSLLTESQLKSCIAMTRQRVTDLKEIMKAN